MKRVILSKNAQSYILREASYLRQFSPVAARRFVERLREARRHLATFEELGFKRDAPPVPGVRRLVVGNYLLDYLPGETIVVLAIRHGRQQEPETDGEEDADYEA